MSAIPTPPPHESTPLLEFDSAPLLEFDQLRIDLPVKGEHRTLVHRVDLSIAAGSAVGLVGESGSGKSLTARTVLRLLPPGARVSGDVRYDGVSVPAMGPAALRTLRSREAAMIFQDPRAHINPLRTIGDFLTEGLVTTRGERRAAAGDKAAALLREVGIADAARRLRQRPAELSGGLLQRVMIAAALLGGPRLLLADEPTTALDVTTQAEVMALIDEARTQRGLAMLFITHDLALAAAVCDQIAVLYAGSVAEQLPAARLYDDARHPYTRALLASRPTPKDGARPLRAIGGNPLTAYEAGPGCAFAPRCPAARARCESERPHLERLGDGSVACHYPHTLAPVRHGPDRSTPHG
ncbi:ABC transporter ATP-binding protein [Streptomyces sp. NPDC054871]